MTETRGQILLPGDPESLLQSTKAQRTVAQQGISHYLALSVTVHTDGRVLVRRLKLDPSSRRVLPELLDEIQPGFGAALTPAEVLRHWAHELVLDSWDTPM